MAHILHSLTHSLTYSLTHSLTTDTFKDLYKIHCGRQTAGFLRSAFFCLAAEKILGFAGL
jgi:hypothetical protein